MLKISNEIDVLIFVENGDVKALQAIVLLSFLGIPICEETHMKHVGIFNLDINF